MKALTLFLSGAVLTICLLLASTDAMAQYNPLEQACNELGNQSNAVCDDSRTEGYINPITGDDGVVATVARILALVIGVAAVIMLILGGLAFVTSGGRPEAQAKARSRVLYSIIGLAVAALGWTIIGFITSRIL